MLPHSYVEVLTPSSSEWTIFGDRVFKGVIKLKELIRVDPM